MAGPRAAGRKYMQRILVVDSSDAIRQVLVRILRHEGLDAIGVVTAADAIAACEPGAEPTALILAVCHNPDPAEVLAMLLPLRSDPITGSIPLVVAADDADVIAQAKSLGACDCLVRAWGKLDELTACVRRNLPT